MKPWYNVPPLPKLFPSRFVKFELSSLKGLPNEFRPESRPKPSPAVYSKFPIDLVLTIYSDEYQPVPMKSLKPTDTAGKYFPSSNVAIWASKLLS